MQMRATTTGVYTFYGSQDYTRSQHECLNIFQQSQILICRDVKGPVRLCTSLPRSHNNGSSVTSNVACVQSLFFNSCQRSLVLLYIDFESVVVYFCNFLHLQLLLFFAMCVRIPTISMLLAIVSSLFKQVGFGSVTSLKHLQDLPGFSTHSAFVLYTFRVPYFLLSSLQHR